MLFAALDTLVDAQVSALQTLFAGFTHVQGGGLRGGRFSASTDGRACGCTATSWCRACGSAARCGRRGGAGTVTVDGPGRWTAR